MSVGWFRKKNLSICVTISLMLSTFFFCMSFPPLHDSCGVLASDHGSRTVPVRFLYRDPQAQRVCVMGSFNEWSPHAHCMNWERGVWSITVLLSPGRYEYHFLIDGRIRQKDPGALFAQDNGFGEENSVLVVE